MRETFRAHRLIWRQIRLQKITVIVAIWIQIFTRCSLETSCVYCCFGPSHTASVPTSSLSVVEHLRSGAFIYFWIWSFFWVILCFNFGFPSFLHSLNNHTVSLFYFWYLVAGFLFKKLARFTVNFFVRCSCLVDFGWHVSKTDSMYILHIEKHWDASGTELICATVLPAETQTLPSMNGDQLQQPWRSTNKANNVPGGNLGKHKSVLAKTGPISCKFKTSKSTNVQQHTCKTFGAEIHSFAWAEETIRKKRQIC